MEDFIDQIWVAARAHTENWPEHGITQKELADIVAVANGRPKNLTITRSDATQMHQFANSIYQISNAMTRLRKENKEFPYKLADVKNENNEAQQYKFFINLKTETAASLTELQDTRVFFQHHDKEWLAGILKECGYEIKEGKLQRPPKPIRPASHMCASCGLHIL